MIIGKSTYYYNVVTNKDYLFTTNSHPCHIISVISTATESDYFLNRSKEERLNTKRYIV